MSSKQTKARVANAFRAMKDIGISEAMVKPVLKKLLKLYDKNWELIEEENYRALADAIFEGQEAEHSMKTVDREASECSKKKTNAEERLEQQAQAAEESTQPLKRARLRYQDGRSTSSAAATDRGPTMPLIIPKDEPTEPPNIRSPEVNASQGLVLTPQPSAENRRRTDPQLLGKVKGKQPAYSESLVVHEACDPCQPNSATSPSHAMKLRDRGKQSICLQTSSGDKSLFPHGSPQATRKKEWKVVRGCVPAPKKKRASNFALIIPKEEPVTDDMPQLVLPDAIIDPEQSIKRDSSDQNGSVRELSCFEPSASASVNGKERNNRAAEAITNGELELASSQFASNLEIASSPLGEVKISLSCNLPLVRPDSDMPSLETVLQLVDDKCLRSHKTLGPNFSVMNILKEVCQCFLNLRSDQNSVGPSTIDMHPTHLPSKSSATDLGAGALRLNSLTGANDPQSNGNLPLSETQPVISCNGTDDGSHLEEMNGGDGHATHTENKEHHVEETNGLNLVVADHSVTPEIIKPLHDLFDIAKGQEKVIISLVNEVNSESLPSFYYIRENVVFQSASVNFSLSHIGDSSCSACSGNCLSSSAPCACAHLVRGEFAYTTDGLVKDGLLKECISMKRDLKKQNQFFCKECPLERSKSDDTPEPCKGHLVRKFIKECWLRCGCNKQCGNRVVQRGITRNLQVFMTPEGKGWGLRTLEDLPEGAFVCEFVGEVLTNSEFFGRILRSTKQEKYSYPIVLDAHWGAKKSLKNEEALCLDASNYGNVARFISHRCYDSNLVEIPVKVETSDHHYYRLALFTARKITVMEELTWDYGIDFDDHDHPVKAFHCQCGSKFCRNIRRSRSRA
ncbi:probable inactive histone-lysine N-methyltransferase SUVR2 isoform X1 [Salvia splendens]|uniref:probable inactive histone-lysine N-methyltransferase SUVR2 isoform X1 n=1 Tax=Salvia splendens TaxID=180675 RepID=UPI001C274014|nr:probable inactive histone-lysine N-methyltransferase SUVR2 isoform X1 [Salvia splendens]XP_041990294.1 probable inactive histone-lysine N-methyltransferase SUVR2 isoform X1 [Salvia splendens]XP_041990295.1 probable inactive histone-lysine N-methyltransferase SUVR2 isoform X1 [Salvia splendens]XP_041990296.1 probable inactive histone-lysine N-methyltransferase SUVR2 isoform X1 [Salvia splendens]XP_041990297.1 probable inactive histone-lysine N-methyltransferase SUVR2 isoform X1 [Salvia splend